MHDRFHPIGACLLLAGAAVFLSAASHGTGVEGDPTEAAESWLAFMDADEYHESWTEAGQTFQAAFTAEAWAEQAAGVRQQIGNIVVREVTHTTPMTDPPGAPPGEYVQIHYRSEFSEAGAANEMVVVVNEGDRGWRVAGYFVQPIAG